MQKIATFRCKDLGLSCDYEMQAENEMEIMKRIEGHVKTVHQIDMGTPEGRERVFRVLQYPKK